MVAPTSFENLLDFDMVGTEAAVELKVVGVVQKGTAKRGKQFLNEQNCREKQLRKKLTNMKKLSCIKRVCACAPVRG